MLAADCDSDELRVMHHWRDLGCRGKHDNRRSGGCIRNCIACLGLLQRHAGQMQAKLVGAGHSDTARPRVRPTVLLSQGVACHSLHIACEESCRLMQCVYALAVVDSTYVECMVWLG